MLTAAGAMIVRDGKGWGVVNRDGRSTSYGWVSFDDASLYDFVEGKTPEYYAGGYLGCENGFLAGAAVKRVERITETRFVEVSE